MPVNYCFKGYVPNKEVLDYYAHNYVDCFVTASETEGLPVSVMEAMSAGIPIVATNVGGMSELVDGNGYLVDGNASAAEIADAIQRVLFARDPEKNMMRIRSRTIWENKYNAEYNAEQFANDINQNYGEPKRINIITHGYPYGGEVSFIEPEIKAFLKHFDIRIIAIISTEICEKNERETREYIRSIVDNSNSDHIIDVLACKMEYCFIKLLPYLVSYLFDPNIKAEKQMIRAVKGERCKRTWFSMKYYAKSRLFLKWLKSEGICSGNCDDRLFYTFWYDYETLGLCLNKNKRLEIITRAHGYDLYNERVKSGRQPFREVMNRIIDRIVFVSDQGRQYYLNNWRDCDHTKTEVRYLGSDSPGVMDSEYVSTQLIRIVSCSSIIDLKRVDKIIDAVSILSSRLPELNIEWTHFGDGDRMYMIKKYASERL